MIYELVSYNLQMLGPDRQEPDRAKLLEGVKVRLDFGQDEGSSRVFAVLNIIIDHVDTDIGLQMWL